MLISVTLEILGSHATCAKQVVEKDQKFKEVEVDMQGQVIDVWTRKLGNIRG
jgi:hypothetical protein